ncbi:MAG: cytochrome C [Gemmatimonadetes bacterium]|nr:cytochrome C [Gemmatimonadota bacterium]
MLRSRHLALTLACLLPAALAAQDKPKVVASSPEAAGEYLMILGSCHDCHTAGWTAAKGKVAKDDQLTGNPVGYKGPWGTVYGKNLRSIAARQSEDHWVKVMTTADDGEGKLPMPWHNTALMTEEDIRNTFKYTKSLGNKVGARLPRSAKPGADPFGEYVDLSTKQGAPLPPVDTTKKPAGPETKKPK